MWTRGQYRWAGAAWGGVLQCRAGARPHEGLQLPPWPPNVQASPQRFPGFLEHLPPHQATETLHGTRPRVMCACWSVCGVGRGSLGLSEKTPVRCGDKSAAQPHGAPPGGSCHRRRGAPRGPRGLCRASSAGYLQMAGPGLLLGAFALGSSLDLGPGILSEDPQQRCVGVRPAPAS